MWYWYVLLACTSALFASSVTRLTQQELLLYPMVIDFGEAVNSCDLGVAHIGDLIERKEYEELGLIKWALKSLFSNKPRGWFITTTKEMRDYIYSTDLGDYCSKMARIASNGCSTKELCSFPMYSSKCISYSHQSVHSLNMWLQKMRLSLNSCMQRQQRIHSLINCMAATPGQASEHITAITHLVHTIAEQLETVQQMRHTLPFAFPVELSTEDLSNLCDPKNSNDSEGLDLDIRLSSPRIKDTNPTLYK